MGLNRACNPFLPTVNAQDEIKKPARIKVNIAITAFFHSQRLSLSLSKEYNINHMATVMGSGTAVCQMKQ